MIMVRTCTLCRDTYSLVLIIYFITNALLRALRVASFSLHGLTIGITGMTLEVATVKADGRRNDIVQGLDQSLGTVAGRL